MQSTFIAAVLFEKGILNKSEAVALAKMSRNETFSDSLQEMITKVGKVLRTNLDYDRKKLTNLDEIDAVDLLKK